MSIENVWMGLGGSYPLGYPFGPLGVWIALDVVSSELDTFSPQICTALPDFDVEQNDPVLEPNVLGIFVLHTRLCKTVFLRFDVSHLYLYSSLDFSLCFLYSLQIQLSCTVKS